MTKQQRHQWALIIKHKIKAETTEDPKIKEVEQMIAGHLMNGLVRQYGLVEFTEVLEREEKALEYKSEALENTRKSLFN